MARRSAVPLYKTRHVALIEACLDSDQTTKSTAVHLAAGTGPRNDTVGHTHADWFYYTRSGDLYYKIPGQQECRKDSKHDRCGHCRDLGHENGFEPKTPAGEGRRILVSNRWTNPVTKEKEYFGLQDAIEDYFALDGPRAPDGLQHGHKMFTTREGPGVSPARLNEWLRDIAAEADITARERDRRLRDALNIEDVDDDENDRQQEQIIDFGVDEHGNSIPDLIMHDLRATFCTQLMRNDVSRDKAINKTGHKDPDSLNPYIAFAAKEIGPDEEKDHY